MAKYTNELNGAQQRVNELLKPSGYSVKYNHQNGFTVIYITNLPNNSSDLLAGGLTDKTALDYYYTMCKTIGLIQFPAYTHK